MTALTDEVRVILVCGGRTYSDRGHVYAVLDMYLFRWGDVLIFQGACTKGGADLLAEDWAKSREMVYVGVPAKWKKLHNAAGPERNRRMFDLARPHDVVAFPGARGTLDMCKYAKSKGVEPYMTGWEK